MTGQRPAGSRRRAPSLLLSLLLVLATGILAAVVPTPAQAATLQPGFQESVVFSGLTNPTVGPVQPATGASSSPRSSGVIKVFDSLTDPSPDVFADLNANVHNFWDRGLLGMALAPGFPSNPYVYVLYTYDHELGCTRPLRAGAPRASTRTRARPRRARPRTGAW